MHCSQIVYQVDYFFFHQIWDIFSHCFFEYVSYPFLLPPSFWYSVLMLVCLLEKTVAGRDCGQEEKGTTEDEMAGWHH